MKDKQITMDEILPAMNIELDAGKKVEFEPRGVSMLPYIKPQKNSVVIEKGIIKKYDIALFKYNNKYLLHRAIKKNGNTYIFRGDNCISSETGVNERDIIGKVVYIRREGKLVSTDNIKSKIYSRIWVNFHFLLVFLKKVKNKIKG